MWHCRLWQLCGGRSSDLESHARAIAEAIARRGPDESGVWFDPEAGLALAHRRLVVLDLAPAGHQPMSSAIGRYVIAFIGKIYNHLGVSP